MRQGWKRLRTIAQVLILGSLTLAGSNPAAAGGKPIPDNRLGIATAPLLLLTRPEVVSDLEMSDAQSLAAEEAIARLYNRAASIRGKTGAAAIAARKLIDQEQIQWLEANLSDRQRERLLQIELQWEGASALVTRPILSDTLRLTPEQKSQLTSGKQKRDQARKSNPVAYKMIEDQWSRQALTILDETQRDLWKAMLGHPLPFHIAAETTSTSTPTAKK